MKKFLKTIPLMIALCLILAVGAFASGEPSGEASAEPVAQTVNADPSGEPVCETTTIVYNGVEYTVPVYTFNGEEYVKLEDIREILSGNQEDDSASGEPVTEMDTAASGEPSGEPAVEADNVASGEPVAEMDNAASGEPSGEPVAETDTAASGEPSGEPVTETDNAASGEPVAETAVESSFDVTIRVNGTDYAVAPVTAAVEGNTYTFQIGELLAAFGLELSYDEETDVASITADVTSILGMLMLQELGMDETAEEVLEAELPVAEEETPAIEEQPSVEDAAEEAAPATDGTENQANVLASATQPETEEEYEAYEAYLVQYMDAYAGVGDGTFDDGAKAMALAELDSVSFGADVNAFPFEMFVTQFGAMDYGAFAASGG